MEVAIQDIAAFSVRFRGFRVVKTGCATGGNKDWASRKRMSCDASSGQYRVRAAARIVPQWSSTSL